MLKLFDSNIYSLVSNEAYGAIFRKITIIKIQESVPILSPGEHQQYLYFIKKGVVRSYYKALENEWTNWFAAEENPVFSTESFLNNNPSTEYIETCTPVILYQISKQDYYQLLKNFPELNQLALNLLQNYLLTSEKRMYGLHMLTAYQRYEQFIQTHRHIANRVQMQHIASYLGITPTHLSRVRKEFARKESLLPIQKLNVATRINLC